MASWRDTTSATAQDDLDALLNAAIEFAEQQLVEHGGMYPFAAAVSESGEIDILAFEPDEGEEPEPEDVLENLRVAARESARSGRAAAFVSDVLLEDDADALRIEMEHRDGVTFEIFLPYTSDAETQSIVFGEMAAADGEASIWTDGS
ncbi:MAG: hypothetical protein JWN22_541 [Nocardioides sp.]|jgi:hypothetical protein|nr:hypothetical protein [Nocardioides sp.]